jgi:Right handed beta helix region
MVKKIFYFLYLQFCFFFTKAQDTINITSFGYVVNSHINAVPFVKKALNACKNKKNAVLTFPKGRYDFWPQYCEEKMYYESNSDVIPLRRCPILIEGIKNVTIDAMGSDFIYHDKMQPITIDSSKNIIIKNVNIDWDVPIMGQGQIVAVNTNYIDVAISDETPYEINNGKIFFIGEGWKDEMWDAMEFDKDTKRIAQDCGDGCLKDSFYTYKANEISKGLVRINYLVGRKPGVGNYLAMRHSERGHAGIFIVNSKNVTLENVNMYQNAGLGILSQYSENLTFNNVQCIPNPKKNRVFAGHDDGLHFSNCKRQITVDHCKFLGLMDDPINVHGTSVQVVEKISERTLLCKFMHYQSFGFVWARKGEMIGFIENDAMNSFGTGVVESFKARNETEFEISFAAPLPKEMAIGDALENLTWAPDVSIKNNFFGSCRARGVLVTTPGKVIIEKNVFESSGSAILISGDANGWFESGAVKDVLIQNNTFNDPCLTSIFQFCEGIISIYPEIPKLNSNKPFHRNIRIENNTFNPYDYPVLYAKSVEGLTFNDNTIKRSTRFTPMHTRKFMMTLEACKKVTILRNTLVGDVLGKNIKLIATLTTELKLGKKQGIIISVK